jgi:hypothetical protein
VRLGKKVLLAKGVIALIAISYLGAAVYIDNVEHPAYRTVTSDGAIEVRAYAPTIVAEIAVRGERREAVSRAFSPLASYIFAKERPGEAVSMTAPVTQVRREAIAMTAPVTQSTAGDSGEWTVQFTMPAKYSLETLPKPLNKDVSLREVAGIRRAVFRFTGRASDARLAEGEAKLRAWLKARGLKAAGAPTFAYYNSPFTPSFMRRNEIMLDLIEG